MANDGSLKLSQQGGFDLGLFVEGRHTYKNNNLVQGKQTVRGTSTCAPSWTALTRGRTQGARPRAERLWVPHPAAGGEVSWSG